VLLVKFYQILENIVVKSWKELHVVQGYRPMSKSTYRPRESSRQPRQWED